MKLINSARVRFEVNRKERTYKCILTNTETNNEFIGVAKAHKSDSFDKEFGRKKSLRRAFEVSNFTKEERTRMWNKYQNSAKNPRW